jgi:dTDP-4-amino-4,6-dideoxygalactose transaminase
MKVPIEKKYADTNWHLFPLRVPIRERKNIYSKLRENGILAQVNYLPAHLHPVFESKGFKRGDYPVAEAFYDSEISLPMHYGLRDEEIEFICKILKTS